MDAVEFNLSEFKNSVSNDIFLLKSTLSEHATEMLNSRDIVEDTHAHVKKTNNLIEQQDVCIDRLAGIVSQSRMRTVASNVDLGMVRRRLSKVEDFTNEFYEQFESFKSVKEIIVDLSEHLNECDQDISSFFIKENEKVHCHVNDVSNLNVSNYNSDHDHDDSNIDVDANNNKNSGNGNSVNYEITSLKSNEYNSKNEEQEQEQEIVIEDDDFERL
jgi:hypothetical protein